MTVRAKLRPFYRHIFHPFNGFWELKHEKVGNVRTATVFLLLLVAADYLGKQFSGFIYHSGETKDISLLYELAVIFVPFILFCVANYGVTTLMDGKGKFSDIYIACAYALLPVILFTFFLIPVSRITIMQEQSLYNLFNEIGMVWSGLLVFTALMVIHDYSFGKNLAAVLLTLLGMAAVVFLALLLFSLIQQIYNFFYLMLRELALR